MTIQKHATLRQYKILEIMNQATSSILYRVVHREQQLEMVVKQMTVTNPSAISNSQLRLRQWSMVDHAYIMPVRDFWLEDEQWYIVMPLMTSSMATSWNSRRLDYTAITRIVNQVAEALHFMHQHGLAHGNLKPANVLQDGQGNVRLSDPLLFDTSTSAMMQADIHALAKIIFALLGGNFWTEPEATQLQIWPELRTEIDAMFQRALTPHSHDAFTSVLELSQTFEKIAYKIIEPLQEKTQLTDRETEVLKLITDGYTNREIAELLVVSKSTVKWHIRQAYQKLGISDRAQAIQFVQALNQSEQNKTTRNPYKGLRAFQVIDQDDFFGREQIMASILQRLQAPGADGRFLAIVGPSGSGKSSLVNAGVIPAIHQGNVAGLEQCQIIQVVPDTNPFAQLQRALKQNFGVNWQDLYTVYDQLHTTLQAALPTDVELLLVIDQFEEVFTLIDEQSQRQQFIRFIVDTVRHPESSMRVLITLRADFYHRPLQYHEFGQLLKTSTETLLPLSASELKAAITEPAERVGLHFDPEVIASIVSDVMYQPGSLPMLQYCLTEIAETTQSQRITQQDYENLGRIAGVIAFRAEQLFAAMSITEQNLIKQIFLRLVVLGEETRTRRRVLLPEIRSLSDTPDQAESIIQQFVQARLLTTGVDAVSGAGTLEVAHEALISSWERLQAWIEAYKQEIHQQTELSSLAKSWERNDGHPEYLISGKRLAHLSAWCEQTTLALTFTEQAYLQACQAQEQLEQDSKKKQKQRLQQLKQLVRIAATVLVSVLLIATIATTYLAISASEAREMAEAERDTARRAADVSNSLEMSARARQLFAEHRYDEALTLALDANALEAPPGEAQQVLADIAYSPGTRWQRQAHTAVITDITASPNGKFATSSYDGSIHIWDGATYRQLDSIDGHRGEVTAIGFQDDVLVSASMDHTVKVWQAPDYDLASNFTAHEVPVSALAIHPEEALVASGSEDGQIHVWQLQTGEIVHTFDVHQLAITTLEYDASGVHLVSGGIDGFVHVWDIMTGEQVAMFQATQRRESYAIIDITFTTEAQPTEIVIGTENSALYVWDYASNTTEILDADIEPTTRITAVDFSVSSNQLAFSLTTGDTFIWDWTTRHQIQQFYTKQMATALIFGEDLLLVGQSDGLTRAWSLPTYAPMIQYQVNGSHLTDLVPLPDGRSMIGASAGGDNVQLSLDETGEELWRDRSFMASYVAAAHPTENYVLFGVADGALLYHDLLTQNTERLGTDYKNSILDIEISNDGQYVAVSTGRAGRQAPNSEIVLLDAHTLQLHTRLTGHDDSITALTFLPGTHQLLSVSADGQLCKWLPNAYTSQRCYHLGGTALTTLVVSTDGHIAFIGTEDGDVIEWDIQGWKHKRTLSNHDDALTDLVLFSNDHFLAAASVDSNILIWDLRMGQTIREFNAHQAPIVALMLDSLQQRLISSDNTGRLMFWPLHTHTELLNWVANYRQSELPAGNASLQSNTILSPPASSSFQLQTAATAATMVPVYETNFADLDDWHNLNAERFSIDERNQQLEWDVWRRGYNLLYIPLERTTSGVRVAFDIQFRGWQANCSIHIGLIESFAAPGNMTQFPNGVFVEAGRFGGGTAYINDYITTGAKFMTDANYQTYTTWNVPDTYISFEYNTWYQIELIVYQRHWQLTVHDVSGNLVGQLAGEMPAAHNSYNYFALMNTSENDSTSGLGVIRSLRIDEMNTALELDNLSD